MFNEMGRQAIFPSAARAFSYFYSMKYRFMKKPKLFLPLFCLAVLVASTALHCSGKKQMAEKEMAIAWIDALNRHDTDGLAGMYTDSAQIESPNWEGVKTGPAGIKEIYGRYFRGTPDLKHQILRITSTDSVIVLEYLSGGTLQNPEKTTPAYMQGKKYSLRNCTRMDVWNGKISRQVSYFDQVSFLRQMGFFDQH
jgi:steroid delta-isomerase-like uncharacterized protein